MSHPTVWADHKAKLQAFAVGRGLPLELPNEGRPDTAGLYLRAEIHAAGAMPVELDQMVWQELGTTVIDVLVPSGQGFDEANIIRHEIGRIFRRGIPPEGLAILETQTPPGDQDDDAGNWFRLTLGIAWRFQDLT